MRSKTIIWFLAPARVRQLKVLSPEPPRLREVISPREARAPDVFLPTHLCVDSHIQKTDGRC